MRKSLQEGGDHGKSTTRGKHKIISFYSCFGPPDIYYLYYNHNSKKSTSGSPSKGESGKPGTQEEQEEQENYEDDFEVGFIGIA